MFDIAKNSLSLHKRNSNMKDRSFSAVANHLNFQAKKLFGEMGQIKDGAIAYIGVRGGGPTEMHTHPHNHLFIVVQGEAKILLGSEEVVVGANESFLVNGETPHAVWNNSEEEECVMVGISTVDCDDK